MKESRDNIEHMRRARFNSIWVVPLVAAIVAGWMLYENWASQGQVITLVAANAEGLDAGQTPLKALNVDVGKVIDIQLSDDYSNAIIKVRMNQGTERMLHEDAKFWVVKPRIGKEGVSGLGTLLSGAYIDMSPGTTGQLKNRFTLLSQPPLSTQNDGIRILLRSHDAAKLDVGTLVHFRGYEVGYVEDVSFDTKTGDITYRIVVQAPYDSLVTNTVQFWITPGLSFKSSESGFEVTLDSLETFISGGISFGLGDGQMAGTPVDDMASFKLFASKEDAANNLYDQHVDYIFLFDTNVSGLYPGAAVEFRGIRVGTVLDVPFKDFPKDTLPMLSSHLIPVRARIEPQRLNSSKTPSTLTEDDWHKVIDKEIDNGLRATLMISNYLNAARVINLDFDENAKPVNHDDLAHYHIFPTGADSLDNIEAKVSAILDKIADVPFKETFASLGNTMDEATETLDQLESVAQSVQKLIDQSDVQKLPADASDVLNQLSLTLSAYQANGQIGRPLRENMVALEKALNELQPLLRQLREKPNTLIFDTAPRPEVEPKAAK